MGKTSKNHPQIILQPRDYIFLITLCDFGYLNTTQVAKWIFFSQRRIATERLSLLAKAGLIVRLPMMEAWGAAIYVPKMRILSRVLPSECIERGRRSVAYKLWLRFNFNHESTTRDIALRILSHVPKATIDLDHHLRWLDWEGDYSEERKGRKKPDFVVRIGKKRVAVFEIELTLKSRMRYFRIFNKLIKNARSPVVYICGTPAIQSAVVEEFNSVARYLANRDRISPPKLITRLISEIENDGIVHLIRELLGPEIFQTVHREVPVVHYTLKYAK